MQASLWCTKGVKRLFFCSSTNFVLYHDLVRTRPRKFLIGHDLVCELDCARAQHFVLEHKLDRAWAQSSCSKIFVLEQKNKVLTPLVRHTSWRFTLVRSSSLICSLSISSFQMTFLDGVCGSSASASWDGVPDFSGVPSRVLRFFSLSVMTQRHSFYQDCMHPCFRYICLKGT